MRYRGDDVGYQYLCFIYGIDRNAGCIILRIDHLVMESGLFNVSFLVQENYLGPHTRAVADVGRHLSRIAKSAPQGHRSLSPLANLSLNENVVTDCSYLRTILFPEKEDGIMQTTMDKGVYPHVWYDRDLNYEQQVGLLADLTSGA